MPKNQRHSDGDVPDSIAGRVNLGDYDPAQFIVPAQDAKGHSERQWFRCQPGHDRQADLILRSKKFPFRTKGDMFRWCMVNGFRELMALEEGVPSIMAQVDAISELMAAEEFQQEFMQTFETMSRVIAKHIEMQAVGEARRVIATVKGLLEQMPDGYWKEKYKGEIKQRFGHYLDAKGIKLQGQAAGGGGAD